MQNRPNRIAGGRWEWAFRRIREIGQREGTRGFVYRTLALIGYRTVGRYQRALDAPIELASAQIPIEIGRLTAEHVGEYVAFRRGATPLQFLSRLEEGHCCYAARHDGQLASTAWVAERSAWVEALGQHISLDQGEMYIFDAFTLSDYRGQHIQPRIVSTILLDFKAAGFRQAVSLIAPYNRSNIIVRERAGFRRTGAINCIKAGSLSWTFFRRERGSSRSRQEQTVMSR
jgi:ribosomal protein S18 acetylase RimI-like enzyme